MSGSDQEFTASFDEECENCHDPLNSEHNWSVTDIRANIFYCTKPECQEAKPAFIKNLMKGRSSKKSREIDKGLSHQLKEQSRFTRITPDKNNVDRFSEMISNPRMLNAKGWPKYSTIFREYKINEAAIGLTSSEMAVVQFPDEIDANGCPSKASVKRIQNHLRSLTRRYDGNLEIYSSQVINPNQPHRTEYRWHINKERDDLDKQVARMAEIANNIALAAKKRENNFTQRSYDERMNKVELLDKFFEK